MTFLCYTGLFMLLCKYNHNPMETQSYQPESSKLAPQLQELKNLRSKPKEARIMPDLKDLGKRVEAQHLKPGNLIDKIDAVSEALLPQLTEQENENPQAAQHEKTLAAVEEAIIYKDEEIVEQLKNLHLPADEKIFNLLQDTHLIELDKKIATAAAGDIERLRAMINLKELLWQRRRLEMRKVEAASLYTGWKSKSK